jgi:hypothetical protein
MAATPLAAAAITRKLAIAIEFFMTASSVLYGGQKAGGRGLHKQPFGSKSDARVTREREVAAAYFQQLDRQKRPGPLPISGRKEPRPRFEWTVGHLDLSIKQDMMAELRNDASPPWTSSRDALFELLRTLARSAV